MLEQTDFVAESPGGFEFQVGCRCAHLLFEVFDIGAQVVADHVCRAVLNLDQHRIAVRYVLDDVADRTLDRLRRDAVFEVILDLLFAPPVGFADRSFHAAGHAVGVQNDAAIHVACGAADGLDERRLAAQKPFLVGVQYRHQPAFGNV